MPLVAVLPPQHWAAEQRSPLGILLSGPAQGPARAVAEHCDAYPRRSGAVSVCYLRVERDKQGDAVTDSFVVCTTPFK